MNEVAKELIAQLVEDLQKARDALIEAHRATEYAREDASMWYRLYTEIQTKLETELPDMEDLNNGNL